MRLFITYAHEDLGVVRGIAEVLAAGGHSIWFDEQLLPGQDWRRDLGSQIAASDAFVYALTQAAVESEWCKWEFASAVHSGKPVIPVLLSREVALPESLKRLQYADFTQGATGMAVAKLLGALHWFQRVASADAPIPPEEPNGIPSRAWESAKHWTDKIVTPRYAPQNQAEDVLGKFGANLFRGVEAVGGRIILTTQRLLFESHGLNIQNEPLAIRLNEIVGVTTCNTLGVVPNGMTVRCKSGEHYQFVLWGRKRAINLIKQQLALI
jgi:hypothetical protein